MRLTTVVELPCVVDLIDATACGADVSRAAKRDESVGARALQESLLQDDSRKRADALVGPQAGN